MAQQHRHENRSQHSSQCSCSSDETQRLDPEPKHNSQAGRPAGLPYASGSLGTGKSLDRQSNPPDKTPCVNALSFALLATGPPAHRPKLYDNINEEQ